MTAPRTNCTPMLQMDVKTDRKVPEGDAEETQALTGNDPMSNGKSVTKVDEEKFQTDNEEQLSDPHATSTHPTTYLETLIHLLKGNIGPGMMAMGDAFKNCGLLLAPGLTLFLGVVCLHAQHMLLAVSKEMQIRTERSKPPNFADTVDLTFTTGPLRVKKYAPYFRGLVNLCICATQLGFCSVYFVFVANSMQQIMDYYNIHIKLVYYMVIILIPIMLSCWIRDLKFLVPVSLLANVLFAFGITSTLYIMSHDLPAISERTYVAPFSRIPLYLGTSMYAFEGICLVLPLQQQMKNRKQFGSPLGVLNIGMGFVTILLIIMGTIGYLKYGEEVKGSLTLNLPEEQMLSQFVQASIAIGVSFTYAIQFHVPVVIIWPVFTRRWGPFKHPKVAQTLLRSALVLFTFGLAATIPHLHLVISLVGSVGSTFLALLIPAILEVVSNWDRGISKLRLTKDVLIFCIGIFGFLTGTYTSLVDIYSAVMKDSL